MKLIGSMLVVVSAAAMVGCVKQATTEVGTNANCTDVLRTPTVSPTTITVSIGDTVRFHALMPATCTAGADSVHFRWSSSSPSRMSVDSLTGLATAIDKGTVAIVATYMPDRTVSGAATVTIGP